MCNGRHLTSILKSTTSGVVGLDKSGGRASKILTTANTLSENLTNDDFLVIICGLNDVACNEVEEEIGKILEIVRTQKCKIF